MPIVGVPNIVRIIEHLKRFDISEIVINLHHLGECIESALGNGSHLNVNIEYSKESEILGTGGGIKKARHLLGNETFIVINGDILFPFDLKQAVEAHAENCGLATMVVRPDPLAETHGAVGLDGNRKVRRLVGAGNQAHCTGSYMFTGVHVLESAIFDLLPENGCIVRGTYMPLVTRQGPLFGIEDKSSFFDLGTVSRFIEANSKLVTGRSTIKGFSPPPEGFHIGAGVTIDSECTISPGCVICDGSTLKGNITLNNTIVMQGATVSKSHKNAVVLRDGTVMKQGDD